MSCWSARSSRWRCCSRRSAPACATRSPLDADDAALRQAIERVGESLVSSRTAPGSGPVELGRVIVAFSTKGGVGKSVVATNLAVALASRSSKQVAIVDGDLQFGDVAVLLGVPPTHTTADAAAAIEHDRHVS